ncbi:hypothetical protein D3C84_1296350 [compost metagenome]
MPSPEVHHLDSLESWYTLGENRPHLFVKLFVQHVEVFEVHFRVILRIGATQVELALWAEEHACRIYG